MGFGIDTGVGRTTSHSVETAQKDGPAGEIEEMTAYGGKFEVTEEVYIDAASFTNAALNGAVGNTGTGLVTANDLVESNTEYARSNKTTVTPQTTSTSTTTTTT